MDTLRSRPGKLAESTHARPEAIVRQVLAKDRSITPERCDTTYVATAMATAAAPLMIHGLNPGREQPKVGLQI
jgi:hypothetical protein